MNQSVPIGVTEITDDDLVKLLSPSKNKDVNKKPTSKLIKATLLASGTKGISSSYQLHPPDNKASDNLQFHGLIELQGKMKEICKEPVDGVDDLVDSVDVDVDDRDHVTRLFPMDLNGSVIRHVHNKDVDHMYLRVLSISTLSSDFFGNFFEDRFVDAVHIFVSM